MGGINTLFIHILFKDTSPLYTPESKGKYDMTSWRKTNTCLSKNVSKLVKNRKLVTFTTTGIIYIQLILVLMHFIT